MVRTSTTARQDYEVDSATVLIAQTKSGKARYVYLTEEAETAFGESTAGLQGDALIFERANGKSPLGSTRCDTAMRQCW